MDKKCIKCCENKELDEFLKNKNSKNGRENICVICNNKRNLERYHKNKELNREKINSFARKSYHKNKEKRNERTKKWRKNNKEHLKIYNSKISQTVNKKESIKQWRLKNKDYTRKYNDEYSKKRIANDPLFKLKDKIRKNILSSIKGKGFKKTSKTLEILGCSYSEFKEYLESKFEPWMNWGYHGKYNGELNYGWDLDHIIPMCSVKTEEEIIKLNHYTNFQPLCGYTNRYIKKGNLL